MRLLQHKKYISIGTLAFLLSILLSFSAASEAANIYPANGWQTSTPEQQGMQSQMLANMIDEIKSNNYSIDSISVIHNGYMVLDVYFHPFAKDLRHHLYSCTKSVMSLLVGIAIDKGYIKSIDQPVIDFFPDKTIQNMDDDKRSMTLEHLLMMASGLDCRDSYHYEWKGLFEMRSRADWAQHVLDLPMVGPPGETFEYCNGVSYLLSVIVSTATWMKTLDFARKYLFDPLGISEVVWEENPQGFTIGYARMWLNPHDMARIGWLCINKGRWGNKQIVSSAWVETSTRGQIDARPAPRYGYHWWVNEKGQYAAVGNYGQYIMVADAMNLVVVFTSDLPLKMNFVPLGLTRKYIVPAVVSSEALPKNEKENTRLDNLVKSVSVPFSDGFVWLSEDEGIARDGVFRRTRAPKLRFKYPVGSKRLSTALSRQIMVMKTPDELRFEANIIDRPENLELKDLGPKLVASYFRQLGIDASVFANVEKTLKCGARAYRTDLRWVYQDLYQMTSVVVSSYKGDQCVFLIVHSVGSPERFAPIVESLRFD